MKADISTLHKQDILILQRHMPRNRCFCWRGMVG